MTKESTFLYKEPSVFAKSVLLYSLFNVLKFDLIPWLDVNDVNCSSVNFLISSFAPILSPSLMMSSIFFLYSSSSVSVFSVCVCVSTVFTLLKSSSVNCLPGLFLLCFLITTLISLSLSLINLSNPSVLQSIFISFSANVFISAGVIIFKFRNSSNFELETAITLSCKPLGCIIRSAGGS